MLDDPYVQVALWAPPSPDYIPGPEEPQSPPLPDFVPKLVYPEYMSQEDEVFPAEEQPLPAAASPTAQSPDYVPESDPEEDLKEDNNEDPKKDLADYPADGGDDGDDDDEPSDDGEEVDIEADERGGGSPSSLPTLQNCCSRISIPAPVPIPVWSDAEVARLLAISTTPSSLFSPWSSPLPQIPSPPLPPILSPLPISSPVPVLSPSPPASPIRPLGYQAAMIRLRAEDIPEVTLPPRKRLGIALGPRYEIEESSSAAAARLAGGLTADYGFVAIIDREIRRDLERDVGYGITDSWDEIIEAMQGTPVVTDVAEFSQRMTKFKTRVRRDIDEVYTRLDDEQTRRKLLAGRLNMLFRDRAHARTARLMETEARMSKEAWGRSMDASDLARAETVITEMLAADHRRQEQLAKALKLVKRLQTQMVLARYNDSWDR
ncbi:hypothetical protein Tco_0479367 [Tanacetum coccineum]